MKIARDELKLTHDQLQMQVIDWCTINHIPCGKVKMKGFKIGNRWLYDKHLWRGHTDLLGFLKVNRERNIALYMEIKVGRDTLKSHQIVFKKYIEKVCDCRHIEVRKLEDVIEVVKEYK